MIQMRTLLQELGFFFDDRELAPTIQMLAGVHARRAAKRGSDDGLITRTTALAALTLQSPVVGETLVAAGLQINDFLIMVDVVGQISTREVVDLELHPDLATALTRFADRHAPPLAFTARNVARAIIEMVTEHPEVGRLGARLMECGAGLQELREVATRLAVDRPPEGAVRLASGGRDQDELVERLLGRRLAFSTMASSDFASARALLNGNPGSWGLGPPIRAGDIILVYFPKTLATATRLIRRSTTQTWGLRFLLLAATESRDAPASANYRQVVDIAQMIDLENPIEVSTFTDGPIADWSLPKKRFRGAGQVSDTADRELAAALWTAIVDANPGVRDELESWLAAMPAQVMSSHATSDLWTVNDRLGYGAYARAIANFLKDPRTDPPLTISVQAPWGGGKTSLMRMVQQELDPVGYEEQARARLRPIDDALKATTGALLSELKSIGDKTEWETKIKLGENGKFASIWFNAWRYQSSDQIWAGLATAIIRGITDRLEPVDREKFLLRLHLSRINPDLVRAKVTDAATARLAGWVRGGWGVAAAVALAGVFWGAQGLAKLGATDSLPAGGVVAATVTTLTAAAAAAADGYRRARAKTKEEPAKLVLSDFVDVPDYSEKLGFVHHATEDLRAVFELMPKSDRDGEIGPAPLVLFIDDLDRCSPDKVADVFEAINLFIAGEFPDCIIVLGMDTEVVAAALEQAHKDVIDNLPDHNRRVPVGWRFMDKFVQLPFVIPPLGDEAVEDYADYLAAAEDRDAHQVQGRARSDEGQQAAQDIIVRSLDAQEDEAKIIEEVTDSYVGSREQHSERAIAEAKRLATAELQSFKQLRRIGEQTRAANNSTGRIQVLLRTARDDFLNNPRELKRLVNVYRFYFNLRLARRELGLDVPNERQLENWLKFSLAWPETVRWLRRSYGKWETEIETDDAISTATGYRLKRLESHATDAVVTGEEGENETSGPTVETWAAGLRAEFGLKETVPWLADERLFQFLQRTARDEDGRLSDGAGRGFW